MMTSSKQWLLGGLLALGLTAAPGSASAKMWVRFGPGGPIVSAQGHMGDKGRSASLPSNDGEGYAPAHRPTASPVRSFLSRQPTVVVAGRSPRSAPVAAQPSAPANVTERAATPVAVERPQAQAQTVAATHYAPPTAHPATVWTHHRAHLFMTSHVRTAADVAHTTRLLGAQ